MAISRNELISAAYTALLSVGTGLILKGDIIYGSISIVLGIGILFLRPRLLANHTLDKTL